MTDLTDQQIIERGAAARQLLLSETFLSFVDEFKQLTLEAIANTTPENSRERELLYYRYQGLTDVVGAMQSYSDAAEAILKKREETD